MEKDYKKIGKIYHFDGEVGFIVTNDNIYNFSKKDLLNELKENDLVEFIPNTIPFNKENLYLAREIEKHKEIKTIR